MKYKFFKMDDTAGPHKMTCETVDSKVTKTCPLLAPHMGNDIRYVMLSCERLGYSAWVSDDQCANEYQLPNIDKSWIGSSPAKGLIHEL